MRLTKRVVDGASYPASNSSKRAFVLWDRDVKGFGVRVYPSGRKTFVFQVHAGGPRPMAHARRLRTAHGQPGTQASHARACTSERRGGSAGG